MSAFQLWQDGGRVASFDGQTALQEVMRYAGQYLGEGAVTIKAMNAESFEELAKGFRHLKSACRRDTQALRVRQALRLTPMTIPSLAKALALSESYAAVTVRRLCEEGVLHRVGFIKGRNGRPAANYGVVVDSTR